MYSQSYLATILRNFKFLFDLRLYTLELGCKLAELH